MLEDQSLLRIHRRRLSRRQGEAAVIEEVRALHESPMPRRTHVPAVGVWRVPSGRGHLLDRTHAARR